MLGRQMLDRPHQRLFDLGRSERQLTARAKLVSNPCLSLAPPRLIRITRVAACAFGPPREFVCMPRAVLGGLEELSKFWVLLQRIPKLVPPLAWIATQSNLRRDI